MKVKNVKQGMVALIVSALSLEGGGLPASAQQEQPSQEQQREQHHGDQHWQERQQQKAQEQERRQQERQSQTQERQHQQERRSQEEQQRQQDRQKQTQERQQQQERQQDTRERRQQQRLSEQQQRQRITDQQQRLVSYEKQLDQQQRRAQERAESFQHQNRQAQYRFQQRYLERLRAQHLRLQNQRDYDYGRDPYFYTAPNWRYSRGGRSYKTNQYGADALRQAVNSGYEEGFQAGQADREDRWRSNYRDAYAYQDATAGYSGYYVDQDEYRYYFRSGFRRGYNDGYHSRSQYGNYIDGKYTILGAVLSQILNMQPLD